MQVLRIEGLPEAPLDAAAAFHAEWMPQARALLASLPKGEDLVLNFPPADHTHRAWHLAAVQGLARESAPLRVNALASDDQAAIESALGYIANAPGLTGQYLALDDTGAGSVIGSLA